jgi:hypothetical protein
MSGTKRFANNPVQQVVAGKNLTISCGMRDRVAGTVAVADLGKF